MGDVLSCIKDAGGAEGVENPIDAELLAQIGEILAQELLDFPETFSETKDGIEWEMVNAAPEPYEEETTKTKLVWGKSSDEEINEVALKVAAGEALKNALKEAVHAAVDPKIEEKTSSMTPPLKSEAEKLADKAISEAVDRGVDEAVKKLSEELKSNPGKFNKPNKPEKGSPKPPPPKKHKAKKK